MIRILDRYGNVKTITTTVITGETDPVWTADKPDYLTIVSASATYSPLAHTHTFASLTSKPTTISGYGITDYNSLWDTRLATKTTNDLADSLNKRYVTDAHLIILGNTSGTNTGDQATITGNAGSATVLQTARKINNVSFDGSADIDTDEKLLAYQALGSTIVAQNVNGGLGDSTGTNTMIDNRVYYMGVYLKKARTITGVKWEQVTQGNYTADGYNGVGLYTYSGGTLTLVASSTDDGNIWKATSATIASKAFSSTYAATAGLYFVAHLYCNSAQTTAPVTGSILGSVGSNVTTDFTNSAKLNGLQSGQTSLPATVAMSSITAYFVEPWAGLY